MKLASSFRFLIIKRHIYKFTYIFPNKKYELTPLSRYTNLVRSTLSNCNVIKRQIYDEKDLIISDDTDSLFEQNESALVQPKSVRDELYPNSSDSLIIEVNKCASVQDVLSFINVRANELRCPHVAQTVLVLWDLQTVFMHVSFLNGTVNDVSKLNREYINKLNTSPEFNRLINIIGAKLFEFDVNQLGVILLHLNKMGFGRKHPISQSLIEQFKCKLSNNEYSLTSLSQFLQCIATARDLSSYYGMQDAVPIVLNQIGKCETAEQIELLTVCLASISNFLTVDIVSTYQNKVNELINNGTITNRNYQTVLKIVSFLTLRQWRDASTIFVSKCTLLLKNHLHLLTVDELLLLSEVLYKNEEPSKILNELQRCASRFLVHLEEDSGLVGLRLKLLLCVVCFSPPSQRPHFEKVIRKYLDYNLTDASLVDLQKIILFNKTNDSVMYRSFWAKLLVALDNEVFRNSFLFKVCYRYITFSQDGNRYRYNRFEEQVLKWLAVELWEGFVPSTASRLSTVVSFLLTYTKDENMMKLCIAKIKQNMNNFNSVDCYNISRCINIAVRLNKSLLEPETVDEIRASLDRCTYENLSKNVSPAARNLLFKGYVYRGSTDEGLLRKLIDDDGASQILSSKLIKNYCFCMNSTQTLVPRVVDEMVDYVVRYEDHVLAFNAERVIYLCYTLGYAPKNADRFFETVINVILRDQERLSGLSHLQTCLSLAYFHALPHSFIRQIFNTEFLEKLDSELENCYFKDTYPFRVRRSMMQLNRTVCLDYPESNVPWFHEKYINSTRDSEEKYFYSKHVRDYLLPLVGGKQHLLQNEITPYGYSLDFVIRLSHDGKMTDTEKGSYKLAVLVMPPAAYTNVDVRLKGPCRLKMRHLEMLGYRVVIINFAEWNGLIYGEDKMDYLKNLIWPNTQWFDADVNR